MWLSMVHFALCCDGVIVIFWNNRGQLWSVNNLIHFLLSTEKWRMHTATYNQRWGLNLFAICTYYIRRFMDSQFVFIRSFIRNSVVNLHIWRDCPILTASRQDSNTLHAGFWSARRNKLRKFWPCRLKVMLRTSSEFVLLREPYRNRNRGFLMKTAIDSNRGLIVQFLSVFLHSFFSIIIKIFGYFLYFLTP